MSFKLILLKELIVSVEVVTSFLPEIKNLVSLFVLFLSSPSVWGDIRSQLVNYIDYQQIDIQAYSPYSPFKEAKYRNVGTGYNDFVLPMDFSMKNAVIQRHSSEMPSKTHNLLISSRHYTFRLLGNGLVDDAIIQSNSSGIPSENTESMKVSGRKNAFAPPTEGMPINDAILPLLIFSFIYLIVKHILKIKAQRI